jgi:hypothetical protein
VKSKTGFQLPPDVSFKKQRLWVLGFKQVTTGENGSRPFPANRHSGRSHYLIPPYLRAIQARPLHEPAAIRPSEPIDKEKNLPGFLYIAMRSDLDLSPTEQRSVIEARVSAIKTRGEARDYIEEVRKKVEAAR